MISHTALQSGVLEETEEEIAVQQVVKAKHNDEHFNPKLLWINVTLHSFVQIMALYAIYLMFTSVNVYTTIFSYLFYLCAEIGITAGAHRLWSHRSYKAKWPLKVMLMIFNTMAFEESVIVWSREHRLHHKYTETDADPHNITRGFFFSHVGWLLCQKHPLVIKKGRQIDLSDLFSDPILKFQRKYYLVIMPILCFFVPIYTPMYFWNESFKNAFAMNMLRYACNLQSTWAINSFAHKFGNKPYNKYINSTETWITSIVTLGEGWHNFHHLFPWDYRASEYQSVFKSSTTRFIDLMAKIGWAYDLRTVTPEIARKRAERTGDGSYHL